MFLMLMLYLATVPIATFFAWCLFRMSDD